MNHDTNSYIGEINFVKELERLKNTTRTAWTSTGRKESTAEHSFRLALFIFVLKDYFPEVDPLKALTMALIHDLGEAFDGDVSATLDPDPEEKAMKEKKGLERLIASLPNKTQGQIVDLFMEYNDGLTSEAKLVKALDKLETIIQHNQGCNPEAFDYGFNLEYGKEYTANHWITREIRELIDIETREKASL